jgi:DNA-binding transcriptional LysR family regulator
MTSWTGIESRHLAALLAVQQEGTFRNAARSLGIVQSALSQRIAQLESVVGMRLVERSSGQTRLRLTEAGELLVDHAKGILGSYGAAFADLRSIANGPADVLRVGAYESVSSALVPPAIKHMTKDSPDLQVSLHEEFEWQRLFPRVINGDLDAAFADLPLEPGPFEFRELILDPCVLIVQSDSPLARRRRPPTFSEIVALPLIAPSWPMLRLIEDSMRAAGTKPSFVFHSKTNSGVQELVAHGLGAALMPRLAVNAEDARIAAIELDGTLPPRRIALYWHRERRESRPVMRFVAALEATCGDLRRSEPAETRQAA